MFDVGFLELVVVGVVALVVLGPEKLPGTVRTVALWVGRLRRSFNTIKQDIEREIGADEIRRQLRNEEIMEKFRNAQTQIKNTIKDVEKGTEDFKKNVELEAQAAAGNPPPQATEKPPLSDTEALSADQESALVAPATPAPAAEPASTTEPAPAAAEVPPAKAQS